MLTALSQGKHETHARSKQEFALCFTLNPARALSMSNTSARSHLEGSQLFFTSKMTGPTSFFIKNNNKMSDEELINVGAQ